MVDNSGNSRNSRIRWLAGALSVAAHLGVGLALLPVLADAPGVPPPVPPPMTVILFEPPPPPPPPPPEPAPAGPTEPAAAPAEAEPSPPPKAPVRPRPSPPPPPRPRPARLPPTISPIPAAPTPAPPEPAPPATLSDAQLAGALVAGSGRGVGGPGSGPGGGGGGPGGSGGAPCDMIRRLQDALRSDPDIRAAVRQAQAAPGTGGRALLLWNGEWIQNPGQEGKGLAGVRQAIAVEVAFAPRECRSQRVSGYAVIAMADGPGAPRVALGADDWRWGDLTRAR